MFTLTKNRKSDPKQAEWFANHTPNFLYGKLNIRKEYISIIKAYYNPTIQSCILKITFNKEYTLGMNNPPLYIMLDYKSKEMSNAGINFENTISDKDKTIQWIHNNETLVFYPDNGIMHLLTKTL